MAHGPGRTPLGPLLEENASPLEIVAVEALQNALATTIDDFRVVIPASDLRGRLAPFNNRARILLVHLLRGWSRGMAAAQAGIAEQTLENWEKRQPTFREATVWASQTGFRRTFEPELYRRAMAGDADRGSMRALELVTKARDSAYRDKSQLQMEVVHRAGESLGRLVGGWDVIEAPATAPNPDAPIV